MKYGGLLQAVIREENKKYAKCVECDLIYEDGYKRLLGSFECDKDGSPILRIIKCPHCGNELTRGLTREQAKELVDEEHKELL